jgi:predicted permease
MASTPMWRRYLRFWGPDPQADVDTEIAGHLQQLVQHYVEQGMTPDEARTAALARFGDAARVREECVAVGDASQRAVKRRQLLDAAWQDLRDAWRGVTRNPGFTAGSALILALGIGFNTAVYSFNTALLFPDVPLGSPARIVRLWAQNMTRGVYVMPLSEGEAADLMTTARSFESLAAYSVESVTLTGRADPERILALRGTTNLSRVLQVSPVRGRGFSEDDAFGTGNPTLILSHRAWRTRFGGDPAAVGRDIHLNGRPHTIAGILPEEFWFESRDVEVWLPMPPPRAEGPRDRRALLIVARLAPGVAASAAQSEVRDIAKRMSAMHPAANEGWDVLLTALLPLGPGEKVFFALVALLTGLLLAASCAHIANMLLARGMERRGEIAIRAAIGARRSRIVRQLLVESAAVAAAGGAVSLAVASWIVAQIRTLLGSRTPFLSDLSLDPGALAVTGGLVLLATLLFGLVPALRLSAVTAGDATRQPPGGPIAGRTRRRVTGALIGLEVAVATLALILSALYARAAANVVAIPLGFETEGVVTFRIDVPAYKYPAPEDAARVLRDIHARVASLPSTLAAGASVRLPLTLGPGLPPQAITVEGRQPVSGGEDPWAVTTVVTPGYFEALRIRIVQGRAFDSRDVSDAPAVAVVSRSLARAYWPDQDLLGRRVSVGGSRHDGRWLTIVGVADDVRPFDPTSPQVRQLYLPFEQAPVRALTYFVAASGGARDDRFPDVRQAVRQADPDLPVLDLRPLTDVMDDLLLGATLGQRSMWANALLAAVLAITGVYSVVAFATARRRREIAIRVAVGGSPLRIVTMLLGEAALPVIAGLAAGAAISVLAGRATALVLFGVNPLDPLTYGMTALLLCAAAAAASSLPALRATRLNVASSLRAE